MEKTKNYFTKLFKGEIPLYQSFWIWFVFLSIFIEIFFNLRFSQDIFITKSFSEFSIFSITLLYAIVLFLIIYKSANNYKGSKVWSFLAKTIITVNLFFSLSFYIDIVKFYFFEDYIIEKEIEFFKSNLPIQVDSSSNLIDIYKNDKNIFYTYVLLDAISFVNIDENRFKKRVQESLCEEESSLSLLKKDYILNYKYLNNNNEKIIDIQTNKENCGKAIYDLEILNAVLKKQGML